MNNMEDRYPAIAGIVFAAIASTIYINAKMVEGITPQEISQVNITNFIIALVAGGVVYYIVEYFLNQRKK
jgi:xanthine/uracil permease